MSAISWWMRLLCQKIAQSANLEEEISGKLWESRFQSVKILDETSLLACAAYVDLNPIRSALVELFGESDYTSAQRRISPCCSSSNGRRWLPVIRGDGRVANLLMTRPPYVLRDQQVNDQAAVDVMAQLEHSAPPPPVSEGNLRRRLVHPHRL